MGLLSLLGFGVTKGIDLSRFDRGNEVLAEAKVAAIARERADGEGPLLTEFRHALANSPSEPTDPAQVNGLPQPSDFGHTNNQAQPNQAQPNGSANNNAALAGNGNPQQPPTSSSGNQKPFDRIRIASFNIKVFGKSKSEDTNVMGVLAHIMQLFDVVAIQEVRSPDSFPVDKLIQRINQGNTRYASSVGVAQGRSSQLEQYAYVWDTTRIREIPNATYVVNDPEDLMHRSPMVATFECIVPANAGRNGFKFTMINVHTDPDEVKGDTPANELNVLDDVYKSVREFEYMRQGEDDFFLVGDLNVDPQHLYELGQIPGLQSVTGPTPTNTKGTAIYDHILVDRMTTSEFTGSAGVLELVQHLGLTPDQAWAVSDHQPIWAEFSIYEQPAFGAIATRPQANAR
ncbi:Endonuclease/Exonuclease/phosphatase family protein [Roseimaritima multifibrata]|uniref:Endonuclease/Exonuclease/phosphatase family protein n=2 Tax=Roseimaritima multifibrata TaxID=1930274 RepID=A0A517MBP5_9BACT|nr:Endonuclease/Exonuclease/phosphatase family protein [Roseimaritima multifibrata]